MGAIGTESVIPTLIRALRQGYDWDNDWIVEEIPSIFGKIGPKALPHIKEVAFDRQAGWYLRIQALAAMAAVTLRRPEEENSVFSLIAGVAADTQEDPETRAWAGRILLDFGKKEHEPVLVSLVESGVMDGIYDQDSIQRAWARPDLSEYDHDWLDFYEPQAIAERLEEHEEDRLPEDEALDDAASVAWGEDPDEDDDGGDEEPEHRSEFIPPKHARMTMERMSFQLSRTIKDKDFKTPDEINAYLKSQEGQTPRPSAPQDAWEVAQNLMYDAWEQDDPRQRVAMARKALAICPECADAYNLLADETAETNEEAIEFYRQALRAGERQLGPEFFRENASHFWGMVETRPYMRARCELSQCLWVAGEREEAIGHWREMLRLNSRDNQGVRYLLATRLGQLGRWQELEKLLEDVEYREDCGLEWLVMKALCAFAGEGPSSRAENLLREALGHNAFLSDYLLGNKSAPRGLPEHFAVGSHEEAVCCAFDVLPAWQRTPKALDWLKGVLGLQVGPKLGRNEPCPCGSGRKFKKCCLGKIPAVGGTA